MTEGRNYMGTATTRKTFHEENTTGRSYNKEKIQQQEGIMIGRYNKRKT